MKFKLIIDKDREEEISVIAHSTSDFIAKIENMVMEHNGKNGIYVYRDDEITHLDFMDIECITIIDRKVYIIGRDGTQYRTNKKLCDIEPELPTYFIRINKSSLANERRIKSYKATFSGAVDAVFKCGYREYVSRRCFANIKKRYEI